ncbi:MAG: class I SAM-dependent methyltransferase [Dehalococcoidia bacterium]
MNHEDHVRLLRAGVPAEGSVWADLGSGDGAFTLALAELIGPSGTIWSVDGDRHSLERQQRAMEERFPDLQVRYVEADFTRSLDLPPLDGIVMANSLHFQREKQPVLTLIRGFLKPNGRFVLVEYNTDHGNHWVPHPLSYSTWESLASSAGFVGTRLSATQPSRFLGQIYSALSLNAGTSLDPSGNVSAGTP